MSVTWAQGPQHLGHPLLPSWARQQGARWEVEQLGLQHLCGIPALLVGGFVCCPTALPTIT